jgi:signal transduction histidine kinase
MTRTLHHAGLFTAVAGAGVLLAAGGLLAPLDRPLSDFNLRLLGSLRRPPPVPVACIVIGEQAFRRIPAGRLRSYLAALVERVEAHKPLGIALDVLLPAGGDESENARLAAALAAGPAVLAAAPEEEPPRRWNLPDSAFRRSAAGHVVAEPDEDGIFRRMSAFKQSEGLSLPALPIVAARFARPGLAFVAGSALVPDFAQAPGSIPVVDAERLFASEGPPLSAHPDPRPIAEGGPSASRQGSRFMPGGPSAAKQGSRSVSPLAGRIVLIGAAAAGASDRVYLPTRRGRPPVPGVEALAAVVAAILDGGLLAELPPLGAGAVLAGAALAVVGWRRRRGRFGLPQLAVAVAVIELAALAALRGARLVLPAASAVAAAGVTALAAAAGEAAAVRRQTRHLADELAGGNPGGAVELPQGAVPRLQLLRELHGKLRAEGDRRRVLLENLDEGVLLWNAAGHLLLGNAAACALLGLEGGPGLAAAGIAPCTRDSSPRTLRRGGRELEIHCRRLPDGGCLGIIRDVTAARQLEVRRRETQRLITHELKTPLTSLAGFGRMLERYQLDPAERRRVAGLIQTESERLGTMVNALLELETLAGGSQEELAMRPLDLGALVSERCEVLRAAAENRGQDLRLEVAAEAPRVWGDAELLGRVVDNLVGNAIKHGSAGTEIAIRLAARGGAAVLEVADQGPGIPADELPRICERFYRGRGAAAGGAGLGLALVQEAVERHGGQVRVRSTLEEGSTFSISIPLREIAEAAS